MSYTLRPYQSEGIQKIFDAWRTGVRSILFQMPTGTGKTVVFCDIVRRGYAYGRKMLIVVHRRELVDQITQKLTAKGIDAGRIISGEPPDYSKIVQVASIQTLSRRQHPKADLVIIDECHHAKAASYARLWTLYPRAKFLGVTATPIRLSGEGFDDVFDVLIPSRQIGEFIADGHLAPVRYLVNSYPSGLQGVKKRRGDYVTEMLGRVMMHTDVMANLLQMYQTQIPGKLTIVFAVTVEHSRQIVARYRDAGIAAAHVDGNTPPTEREEIFDRFRRKDLHVVSNVEIITEGFDFPACETVQLARPTKSLALYLQMVGRVMRPAPGKAHGIVLDHAGLWLDHGLPTIDRDWSLTGKAKHQGGTRCAAYTPEGGLVNIERLPPEELSGLEMTPLTAELERLLSFESYLAIALDKAHKLSSVVYRYRDTLQREGVLMSDTEWTYMTRRLKDSNRLVDPEKRVNPKMLNHIRRELRDTQKEG